MCGGGVSGFVGCGGLCLYSSKSVVKCGEGLLLCLQWSGLCLAPNERLCVWGWGGGSHVVLPMERLSLCSS